MRVKLVSSIILATLPLVLLVVYQWSAIAGLIRSIAGSDERTQSLIVELSTLDNSLMERGHGSEISGEVRIREEGYTKSPRYSEYFDRGRMSQGLVSIREGFEKGIGWVLLISVCLVLGVSHLFVKRMEAHMELLVRKVSAMERGDFSATFPDWIGREINTVAEALQRLSVTLEDSVVHRRHFQDILDSMNEGILVTDLVGFVTYANIRARELLDAPNKEILGEHIATLVTGRWDFDENSGRSRREACLYRPAGESRELVIERSNLTDQERLLRGMLFVVEDVTEKNKLARELADHRDTLARSERLSALGTLGAIVAHKLSQPISSVRLFLQQVKRELEPIDVPERVRENLDDSLAELDRIVAITKQMLRTEQGRLSILDEPSGGTSVWSAAVKIKESLQDAARRRGVMLSVHSEQSDLRVTCSRVELEEILYCLINNSVQAAPEGSHARVDVDIERAGDVALITVTDTCEGIPSDHIDKVFDCFFTTKAEGQGTGLGLAIVRHIAERYGGKVDVSSQEGFGSCFMISLPLNQEVHSGHAAESIRC